MKNRKILFMFAALVIISAIVLTVLASCNKKEEGNQTPTAFEIRDAIERGDVSMWFISVGDKEEDAVPVPVSLSNDDVYELTDEGSEEVNGYAIFFYLNGEDYTMLIPPEVHDDGTRNVHIYKKGESDKTLQCIPILYKDGRLVLAVADINDFSDKGDK